MWRFLLLWLGLSVLLTACPSESADPSDDDDAVDDDDTGEACGRASGGSGGALDSMVWLQVDGFGDALDNSSEYEVLVYAPSSAQVTPMPVLMLVGRRMPLPFAQNEQIFSDLLGMTDWAEEYGWLVMLPNPGNTGGDQINWTDSATDAAFFDAAVDTVAGRWDIDLDRIHAVGSSAGGRAASYLGWAHSDRLASIVNHAGGNPFGTWPETPWDAECAGLFIHDEDDPVVPRAAVEDVVAMWEDAGQVTETYFDYPDEHEWVPESLFPTMKTFFDGVCNER